MSVNVPDYDQLITTSTINITNGATNNLVPAQPTYQFKYITGVCKTDHDVTIQVYQGSGLNDADMEYLTPVTIVGGISEGAGQGFQVQCVAPHFRIDVHNASGSNVTAFKFGAMLRS